MSSEGRPDDLPRLLKPREAFALMGIGVTKGYQLIARGEVPGVVRLGNRCTRIRSSELRRWLEGEKQD